MNIELQIQKINQLIKKGNKFSLSSALEKSLSIKKKNLPQNVSSFVSNLIGITLQKLNRIDESIKYYEESHKIDERNVAPINNLAYIYQNQSDWTKAKSYFDKVEKIEPENLIFLINIANYYASLHLIDKTFFYLEKANKISPNNKQILFNLANNYAHIGNFKESAEIFERIINLDKNFFPAYPQLVKYNKNLDKHLLDSIINLVNDKSIPEELKADLYRALATVYEKTNDDEFFMYLKKSNEIENKKKDFNKEHLLVLKESLIRSFEHQDLEKKFNIPENKQMIFICGLPRSGSTLVEQILSSHSKVNGQGELEYVRLGVENLYLSENKFDINKFNNDLSKNNNCLADFYFNRLKFHQIKENVVVDKALFNFKYMGLLNMCFPNSKIILTKRNLKDVFFSIYRNHFPASIMNWSNNEDDILAFNEAYESLVAFWKSKLKNNIYEINYENLVSDSENEIKKLLEFCELNFEKDCLNHSKNKSNKIIATVSVTQAREPIYKTAIDKSKKYEKYFTKLFSKSK